MYGTDFPKELYRNRRENLARAIRSQSGTGIAIIETSPELLRNRDSEYPFRHDSDFFYLCGFTEPGALLVIDVQEKNTVTTLFCRAKDPEREIWDGLRLGPEVAPNYLGVDKALPITSTDELLPKQIAIHQTIYTPIVRRPNSQIVIDTWIEQIKAQSRSGITPPHTICDIEQIVHEMRLFKDTHEIDIMKRAARISAGAHVRAIQHCRPGLREYHLEAELLHEFRRHGSQHVAYNSIVAAGSNTCILHHRAGNAELRDGDLCLIDAGCELNGYASDITRTFPVNGKFSGPQRSIYEIVLAAQVAAIEKTKPGNVFTDPHDAAVHVITQGLIDLGIIKADSVANAIEQKLYQPYYMHRTSHWLGMDVHDVGDYRQRNTTLVPPPSRTLEPGMVLTIEPGIYIREGSNTPPEFWNIGIRIEDDALVTLSGSELLSRDAPVSCDEIESIMKDAS